MTHSETGFQVEITADDSLTLASPTEGLWSIASGWENDWPTKWQHGSPQKIERNGPWLVLSGDVKTDQDGRKMQVAYIAEGRFSRCLRRWTWTGHAPGATTTLLVRWLTPEPGALPLLPGICYYGNPSGTAPSVAKYEGKPGEELICEEHRYPMPFASLEWQANGQFAGAALHTLPTTVPYANLAD